MTSLVQRSSPFSLSVGVHVFLVLIVVGLQFAAPLRGRKVAIEVIEIPPSTPAALNLQPPKEIDRPKPETKPEQRQVFGANRKSIQSENPTADTVEIKAGNTVAKEMDDLKLDANDADSIPIPADDYLVTSMPVLVSQVRIPYPAKAKKAGVEGAVVMDMIIDDQGKVRQVSLVRGPGYDLNDAALEAMKQVQFRPGKIGEKSVAVKFRYTYRFVLDHM
jgi:periplasmic protein TonB